MIPVALGAIWFGSTPFALFTFLIGIAMAFEWARLAHGRAPNWHFWISSIGLACGVAALSLGRPDLSVTAALATALTASVAARAMGLRVPWPVFGALYVLAPCFALIWLRDQPGVGLQTVVWLCAIVWSADSAAYAVGRAIGGPKLAPSISPNKTWSGFSGGLAAGTVAAGAVSWLIGAPMPTLAALIGFLVAIVTELGDLGESLIKRYFGVKHTSGLIPGHGGVLDRLDGMIAATLLVALLTGMSGESPLLWG